MHDDCLKTEHKYSILHIYRYNKYIFPLEDKTFEDILKYASRLETLYRDFVLPMEIELKEHLFMRYKLINEGELFCSDFRYRFTDEKASDYIG